MILCQEEAAAVAAVLEAEGAALVAAEAADRSGEVYLAPAGVEEAQALLGAEAR